MSLFKRIPIPILSLVLLLLLSLSLLEGITGAQADDRLLRKTSNQEEFEQIQRELQEGDTADVFISVFELVYETKELSTDDVDPVSEKLDEAYRNIIGKYENPFNITMVFSEFILTKEVYFEDVGGRQLQLRTGNRVRARVTAGGRCNACGSSSMFTNQVSGRLLEETRPLLSGGQRQRRRRQQRQRSSRNLAGKGKGKGKGSSSSSGKAGGGSTSNPPPSSTGSSTGSSTTGTTTGGTSFVVSQGPDGTTIVTSGNGETTVINGSRTTPTPNPTAAPIGTPNPTAAPIASGSGTGNSNVLINGLIAGVPTEEDLRIAFSSLILAAETGNVIDVLDVAEI